MAIDPERFGGVEFLISRAALREPSLGDGVTVAQQILVLLVQVRILIPQ
jgi:hypothetical protein